MTEPSKETLAAVADACAQAKRTLLAYRLYGEVHEKCASLEVGLHQRLRSLVEGGEELVLEVAPGVLRLGERNVLEDDGKDAIVGCLFADGVKQLRIAPGVEDVEVVRLLRRWSTALRDRFAPDYSFSTALWEDDLAHISVRVLDALGTNEESETDQERTSSAGRVEVLMRGLQSALPSSGLTLVSPGALWALARDKSLGALGAAELNARAEAERLPVQGISDADLNGIAVALGAARQGMSQRALINAFHALTFARLEEERAGLLAFVGDLIVLLLEERRQDELQTAITTVVADATSAAPAPRLADLEAFMGCLADPRVLGALVGLFDDRERRSDARALLQYLPKRRSEALLDMLRVPTSTEGQLALLQLVAAKRPDAAALVAAGERDPQLLPELVRVGRRLSVEHVTALLEHALAQADDDAAVAREVFRKIKPPEVAAFRPQLLRAAAHKDPELRATVTNLLTRARDPEAVLLLQAGIEAGVEVDKQRAAVAGLASMGTAAARAALRALFGAKLDVDIRAAIALALAQCRDSEARPLLSVEAKRVFGPRALKAACQEALRRMDAAATTTPATPTRPATEVDDDD